MLKPNPCKVKRVNIPTLSTLNEGNNNNLSTTNTNIHYYYIRSKASPIHNNLSNHLINLVLNKDTGKLEEYRQLCIGKDKVQWTRLFSNELGHLAYGIRDIKVTYCISFIYYYYI